MCTMELQSLRPPNELPAEEDIAAYEPSPHTGRNGEAEHQPGTPRDWTGTMTDHAWEEDGALTVQESGECDLRSLPTIPVEEQGELLRRLSALHLAERAVPALRGPRYSEEGRSVRSRIDARYPEPLSTEESPRRRARSLPWNPIPEAEDEDDSLMCCCKLKKKVQFADSLGLCLASVKHFLPSDEPLVPPAVLARLQSYPPAVPELQLVEDMAMSEGPVPAELLARLDEQGVCLEQVSASAWGVIGYVLVKDPGDSAQVKIRYTFNEWLSFLDCPASAPQQSPAPGTQRFHFNLCYPPSTSLIHFAICFTTSHGQEIWDNNQGVNYTVSCHQTWLPELPPCSPGQEEAGGYQQW
ncbi:protein phosphatase 1 regulatory subunit 3G [Phyllobates terribilis]|uniref:protein phosphatase 1 regulatory subunit 3G n=1 Tax=Phyllobates terribilis TaxID=111132 RepID=UPI003CCAA686